MTYGEAFTVQPFNNLVTTQTFTGAQIKTVLEQQRFPGDRAANQVLVLQVSAGFTYTYDTSAAGRFPGQQHGAERDARSTRRPPTG